MPKYFILRERRGDGRGAQEGCAKIPDSRRRTKRNALQAPPTSCGTHRARSGGHIEEGAAGRQALLRRWAGRRDEPKHTTENSDTGEHIEGKDSMQLAITMQLRGEPSKRRWPAWEVLAERAPPVQPVWGERAATRETRRGARYYAARRDHDGRRGRKESAATRASLAARARSRARVNERVLEAGLRQKELILGARSLNAQDRRRPSLGEADEMVVAKEGSAFTQAAPQLSHVGDGCPIFHPAFRMFQVPIDSPANLNNLQAHTRAGTTGKCSKGVLRRECNKNFPIAALDATGDDTFISHTERS
ncbi:hypothetical protein FB451DRAFT_1172053 [Mycena latifolia]|nr:hypothetical protein FB451DRAFT_1172053 [Mycena latifolia]